MTIQTTRWSPDTCPCVIEYSWDDTLSEANRIHTLSTISKCPTHQALSDNTAYSTVLDENPRKNIAHQLVLDNGPATLSDLINGTRQLKAGIVLGFSWSGTVPNRVLTISYTGITLTTNQKNSIQTFLNNRFGSGKVLIA
jgi:hypothetical protein